MTTRHQSRSNNSNIDDGVGGLHHRRVVGLSNSSASKLSPSSSRPPILQHQVLYSKNKDHDNGSTSSSPWLSRQYHRLLLHKKSSIKFKCMHLVITAALMLLIAIRITTSSNDLRGSSISFGLMRCSSFLRSSLKHQRDESQSRLILMASHLRHGPDGQMRLRIIEHNLRLLANSALENKDEEKLPRGGELEQQKQRGKPLKAILLFSIDTQSTQSEIQTLINTWRKQMADNHDAHNLAYNIISQIIYVPNNPTMVDASKWIVAIDKLLPEIQAFNARVMLINDSFVLTRNVPELWSDNCGDVCGLVWTASKDDPTRHIQSYIRTLSSCAVERYKRFYWERSTKIHNVHELIVQFEMNLDWIGRGEKDGGVNAIYEFAGAHPDADKAQKVLIPKGYPAIKLKKFFVTDDPWLSEPESTRSRLPPSFSTSIYKRMNHDLNHLSDEHLKKHFAENGKNEDRIYSSLPLVIKSWLREELIKMESDGDDHDGGGESTIDILEAYLAALNRGIVNAQS